MGVSPLGTQWRVGGAGVLIQLCGRPRGRVQGFQRSNQFIQVAGE
jgi:hypothetical protein